MDQSISMLYSHWCFESHIACFNVYVSAGAIAVCREYKVHNADIHMKEDCDVDDLVRVPLQA